MLDIPARMLEFPATADSEHTIRIDLRYLLTQRQPYTHAHLNYHADREWPTKPDYGLMLSQQLRRIEGVSVVTITHYGCKVQIGAYYDPRELKKRIREAVEFTLKTAIPWTVGRNRRDKELSFCFGRAIVTGSSTGVNLTDHREDHKAITDFGRRVITGLNHPMGKPWILYEHHLFMGVNDPQDWATIDLEFDRLAAKLVGVRDARFDWE